MKHSAEKYLKLCRWTARKYAGRLPEDDVQDLISELYLAVVRSLKRYDPAKGAAEATYVTNAIHGRAMQWFRDEAPGSIGRWAWHDLTANPNVTAQRLADCRRKWQFTHAAALHEPIDEGRTWADVVPDPRPSPEELAVEAVEAEALWESILALPKGYRLLLCYAGGLTERETAAREGVSCSAVAQTNQRSIRLLRKALAP